MNFGGSPLSERPLRDVTYAEVHITRNVLPNLPWSSLVEGDEQVDRPNSQTTMESCHACDA